MAKFFDFKQFRIQQDKCAMKVGTDGVMLGAWVECQIDAPRILDIGSGSGLIALILAQRYPNAQITGIEIEENAYLQSKENVLDSSWSDRIRMVHSSLQAYATNQKFDLIISNPPFFTSHIDLSSERRNARQQRTLDFHVLLSISSSMLAKNGIISLVIPYQDEEVILNIAESVGINLIRLCRVKSLPDKSFFRSLMEFSLDNRPVQHSTLILEKSHLDYSKPYKKLVKDFYLNL